MTTPEEYKLCPKRRYETKEEAEEMIKHIIKLDWTILSTYKCHICHNWHLTSKVSKLGKRK